ncbi:MAG: hypothetical protein F7B95_01795 [Desulfurococcales archaeon]|nr:hypothetical protein [Desulfurococcales archaeon]
MPGTENESEEQGKYTVAMGIEKFSAAFDDIELEAQIILHAIPIETRRYQSLEELLAEIVSRSDQEKLVRATIDLIGGSCRLHAFNGIVVSAVCELRETKYYGIEALSVAEEEYRPQPITLLSVSIDVLPDHIKELLASARPAGKGGPPPYSWIGSSIMGYTILSILSDKGAFSYLLEAQSPWGEHVAVKIPKIEVGRDESVKLFRAAAQAQFQMLIHLSDESRIKRLLEASGYPLTLSGELALMSSNVISVYAVSIPRTRYEDLASYVRNPPIIVMELASGDLSDLLRKGALEDEKLMDNIIRDLVGTVALAHLLGIGHFDLKPSNVLYRRIDDSIKIKLTDFSGYEALGGLFDVELFTPEYCDPVLLARRGLGVTLSSDVYNLASLIASLKKRAPLYCTWLLNSKILAILTGTPYTDKQLEALIQSFPEVRRYDEKLTAIARRVSRKKTGPKLLLENSESIYLECLDKELSDIREPLRGILREALSLREDERPRNAIEFYMKLQGKA